MKIILIISFFLCLIFPSCGDDPVTTENNPDNNFRYPFSIGSSWYYGTRNFLTNIRIDSASNPFTTDTLTGYGDASFISDTVINSDTLRLFRNSHSEEGHAHSTIELYKQTDSGLIRYAYYSDGTNFGPFRPAGGYRFTFKNNSFNSLNDLFGFYSGDESGLSDNNFSDSVLYFDNPPVTVLKYPLTTGSEWLFKITGTTKFTKKYLNYENTESSGMNYYCIKIRKFWYMNNSAMPEANLIFYDYFSGSGMVKRDFTIKDIQVSNQSGKLIGYIDAKEESFLNIFIQP
ncbi:MAG: hypothetical protein JNJ56_06555 [Ignavibacteria bacterium]|nr:hypothetical protein [Ignavibacteria bacterium]